MKPFIKWPGGKEKEVVKIFEYFPDVINNYYEPFAGGAAVYFSLENYIDVSEKKMFINDISEELISLYKYIKENNRLFFDSIKKIQHNWVILNQVIVLHSKQLLDYYYEYQNDKIDLFELKIKIDNFIKDNATDFNGVMSDKEFNPCIELFVKNIVLYIFRRFKRLKVLSVTHNLDDDDILNSIETSLKGAFYNHYRYIYNKVQAKEINISSEFSSAIYYFIRENCYASMFRYNKFGEFNIPYGGMAYNKKVFASKILDSNIVNYMKNTDIENKDFEEFLNQYPPQSKDFLFVDPPYDSDFSKYSNNEFLKKDHERLCKYLASLNTQIMIVIKKTDYIEDLYKKNGFNIFCFDKKYLVNCKNRNNRNVTHLIITKGYEIKSAINN